MKQSLKNLFKENSILILDGAMATELENMGCNINDDLWSAIVLYNDPEKIQQLHLNYFEAGANISISASYQATVEGFMKKGYSKEESENLIKKSIELLLKAREEYLSKNNNIPPLIAASIGPYGAYLADGSEYIGNYGVSDNTLYSFHKNRMQLLVKAGAEILAIETIPSLQEAIITSTIANELGADCWVSFSCKDERHISEGLPISECGEALKTIPSVKAIGVNCTDPIYVESLIKELKTTWKGHIVVYPNKGESYDPITKTWHGDENLKSFYEWSKQWIEAGADIIGGCCRVGVEDIKEIKKIF